MCKLVKMQTNFGACIDVADIKKNFIENIIVSASQCKQISEIMLFGSSLEERCTKESDIDLVIISKSSVNSLSRLKSYDKFMKSIYEYDMNQEYDRLYFKSMKEIEEKSEEIEICNELIRKGKVIYRRLEEYGTANFAINS